MTTVLRAVLKGAVLFFNRRGESIRLCAAFLLIASPLAAQSARRPPPAASLLRDLNASVEELTARVSLSVVQVLVAGYGAVDEASRGGETGLVVGRQRSIGSGAIIDSDGYIMTNAHVVAGAKHIQVVLHRDTTATEPMRSLGVVSRCNTTCMCFA